MSRFAHFMLNNAFEVDAKAQESKLREKEPLLLHKEEHIELALKEGADSRDKTYFTTHRILVKDGKGIGKKRKNFLSMPYASVQGFAVTTAGSFDDDTELEIWGSAGRLSLNLAKGQVNLFAIQLFLSQQVFQFYEAEGNQDAVNVKAAGAVGSFTSWITGDAATYDNDKIEQRFKHETPVLLGHEKVELAFKTGRDFLVFTNFRILRIDVQGILGKRIDFETILWSSISAATIATSAGIFDRDMEMVLHTNIEPSDKRKRSTIDMDFRRGKVDIFAVQTIISNHILGEDKSQLENVDAGKSSGWSWGSLFNRDANRPIDPKKMDHNLRTNPRLLQSGEHVEVAFKGVRDMAVFTNKRLIIIDPKGATGRRVEYTSVPYKVMQGFAIETAGAVLDMDTEVMIWTDMNPVPEDDKEDPPVPKQPGMAFLELSFNKKLVNIIGLKKYLSERILASQQKGTGGPVAPIVPALEPDESMVGNLLSYFSDNQRAVNPVELNSQFHNKTPLLLDDEAIVMAFKAGRDLTLFTNLRIMVIDVQGLVGKRISYRSIPYSSIRAFEVESAGAWDRDSELDIYTANLWNMEKIEMDFRKGQVDILSVHRLLSAVILGDSNEAAEYLADEGSKLKLHSSGGLGNFINWLGGNSTEQDASKADSQLHSDPPLLLASESVEKVYKSGRDLFVYTSHRVLLIDVKGLRGKKVEYLTIPHKWIHGYEVETAGHMDRDAEVYLKNDIPGKSKVQQDVLVKRGDVMEVQQYLTEKLVISSL